MIGHGENKNNTLEFGISNQELVAVKRTKSKRILITFGVVIILVLTSILLIALYEHIYRLPTPHARVQHHEITLDSILDGTFEPRRFNGTWVSGDEIMMKNVHDQVVLYNVKNGSTTILLRDKRDFSGIFDTELSADKKYLMVTHSVQKIYRHSYFAVYTIVHIETQKRIAIRRDADLLELAQWSTVGNGYVYIYRNDIYYRKSAESTQDIRLTKSGIPFVVYNGRCDWVYEEEVFSASSAVWFSPNGKHIAFVTFNDTTTNIMSISYYGDPGVPLYQYPTVINMRYPKPGRQNPTVTLNVVKVEETELITVNSLSPSNFQEPILSAVAWISSDKLYANWMNRVQNKAETFVYNVAQTEYNVIKNFEKSDGWLDLFKAPIFSADGTKMVYIDSHQQENNGGRFPHVTLFDLVNKKTVPLTSGLFTVVEILEWNEKDHVVYYLATVENHPKYQHVYRVKDDINDSNNKPECISCVHNNGECSYNDATFSTDYSYYILSCNGPNVPSVTLIHSEDNRVIRMWEENTQLKRKIEEISLPSVKYLIVPVTDNLNAHVKLYFPPNFDNSGFKKYPLLVNVYGGPGSNLVLDKYGISWNTYLCVTRNVIVAHIDGRGSGLSGEETLFANYRKLGTYEVADQITVTKYLQDNYSSIDKKRTAIWGWSYGGYVSGMVLANDVNNVFKCGVSVAPVTDWIYYDTIYTERYMGLPNEDNQYGYASSSLINKADKFRNKTYLLVQGTLDDNVHFQHSMQLARELERLDIPFQQQVYSDEKHSLGGVKHHFYHLLESFIVQCFE